MSRYSIGDLVSYCPADHYPRSLGIIIEISKPQLANPNASPYRIHWFEAGHEDAWMRADWLEKLDESR